MFNNILNAKLQFSVGFRADSHPEFVFPRRAEPHLATPRPRPRAATRLGRAGRGGDQVPSVFRGNRLESAGAETDPAAVEAELAERDRHVVLQQEIYVCGHRRGDAARRRGSRVRCRMT